MGLVILIRFVILWLELITFSHKLDGLVSSDLKIFLNAIMHSFALSLFSLIKVQNLSCLFFS